MTALWICDCEHPKSQHKRERNGCRALDCGCAKFDVDLAASAMAQGVELATGGVINQPGPVLLGGGCVAEPSGESTSAALRRVEAERDEARAGHQAVLAEMDELRADLDGARAALRAVNEAAGRDIAKPDEPLLGRLADLRRGRTEATQRALEVAAELASARSELEQLRRELFDVTEDRDLIRDLCQRMERAAGIEPDGDPFDPSDDVIARLRAERDQLRAEAAADVLAAFEMHFCMTCGSRYGKPYTDHPCGRLTPVVVTVTRRNPSA